MRRCGHLWHSGLRDAPTLNDHNRRVIKEVRTGTTTFKGSRTGLPVIPDTQADVGGWEDYPEVHRPQDWDTDHDGLPNAWEVRKGLDPKNAADAAADPDGDGYTNLEDYLNRLVAGSSITKGD